MAAFVSSALPKPPSITELKIWASKLIATKRIVDAVAVADVPLSLSAEAPQRGLNEPREGGGKVRVVGSGVHATGEALDQITTPPGCSAAKSKRVYGIEARQGARPVQEVMDQGIDGDHPSAGHYPALAVGVGTDEQVGQDHRPKLGSDAVDLTEWVEDGAPEQRPAVRVTCAEIGLGKASIYPADEVTVAYVANKQGEAVGCAIQRPLPESKRRQRTRSEMGWLSAGRAGLLVAAFGEMPIARETIAAWGRRQLIEDYAAARGSMLLTVAKRDDVGDALQRDEAHDPIEDRPGVV